MLFPHSVNIPQHLSPENRIYSILVSIDNVLAFPKRFQIMTVTYRARTLEGALSCDKICQWIFFSKHFDDILHVIISDVTKDIIASNNQESFTR